jgi:hypothetical protein
VRSSAVPVVVVAGWAPQPIASSELLDGTATTKDPGGHNGLRRLDQVD